MSEHPITRLEKVRKTIDFIARRATDALLYTARTRARVQHEALRYSMEGRLGSQEFGEAQREHERACVALDQHRFELTALALEEARLQEEVDAQMAALLPTDDDAGAEGGR
jgi:hypothetical protein